MSCSRTGADCKCTYTPACPRRGNCCQCVAFHRDKSEATGCMFTPAGERTYDRSLKNLMRDRGISLT
ncbi:MAG: hypothetical protein A2076_06780 [Geobacteraceae bacterium GWC2_53_11]|nr:MAG: hypothetical protein A2076_06780 [Geobacteraceae bacterium GWC2_53_11]